MLRTIVKHWWVGSSTQYYISGTVWLTLSIIVYIILYSSGVDRTKGGIGVGWCWGGRSRAHTAEGTGCGCSDVQPAASLYSSRDTQRRILKAKGISEQADNISAEVSGGGTGGGQT
jgi:hypothetical protein